MFFNTTNPPLQNVDSFNLQVYSRRCIHTTAMLSLQLPKRLSSTTNEPGMRTSTWSAVWETTEAVAIAKGRIAQLRGERCTKCRGSAARRDTAAGTGRDGTVPSGTRLPWLPGELRALRSRSPCSCSLPLSASPDAAPSAVPGHPRPLFCPPPSASRPSPTLPALLTPL